MPRAYRHFLTGTRLAYHSSLPSKDMDSGQKNAGMTKRKKATVNEGRWRMNVVRPGQANKIM